MMGSSVVFPFPCVGEAVNMLGSLISLGGRVVDKWMDVAFDGRQSNVTMLEEYGMGWGVTTLLI